MSQHILHQNPIPTRRILNKNVRDCSDEFSVLDDGAAAHALDDPTGQGQKVTRMTISLLWRLEEWSIF